MLRYALPILSAVVLYPAFVWGQQPMDTPPDSAETIDPSDVRIPTEVRATRVNGETPVIDGRLDDGAWDYAPVLTQFTQRDPVEGAVASESTAVRFLYNNRSLYVGVRAYDSKPERVYGRLVRRDQRTAADGITVFIDSYHDRSTAFEIAINPSGARRDVFIYNDGRGRDDSWDPVYDWATKKDSLGWTLELRIPFSQLRFPPSDSLIFGVRVRRFIYRLNEDVNWPFVPRDQSGEVSHYAQLVGLDGLPPPKRMEFLPYTAATAKFQLDDPEDPFTNGREAKGRFGADFKIGLTSGLTLDATVNPDFGQVEADAAQVNLSAFETFFPEKRPFFVEGTNLFQFGFTPPEAGRFGVARGGGEGLVYTRRIGRTPQVPPDAAGGFANPIHQTTILGAAKLSGQASGGWALGFMQAVTAKEQAQIIDDTGVRGVSPAEPLTSYTVGRILRTTNRGRVMYGVLGTATIRRLDEPVFDRLHEQAVSGGANLSVRFGGDAYEMAVAAMGSRVAGSQLAISRTQLSSARYFQRPDNDYMDYDSTRTHLSGYAGYFKLAKVTGFMTWSARLTSRSPGFETNDVGFLRFSDYHNARGELNFRWLKPGKVFRRFEWRFSGQAAVTYGFERTHTLADTRIDGDLRNYWNMNVTVQRQFSGLSDRLLRGGPAFEEPNSWQVSWRGRTDWRKPVWLDANVTYNKELVSNSDTWRGGAGISLRPPGSFSISLRAQASRGIADRQYVAARTVGDSTYYLFGRIERKEVSATLRADFALTPRLSLEIYAQPFASSGAYPAYKMVDDPKAADYGDRFDPLGSDRLAENAESDGVFDVDVDRNGETDFSFFNPKFRVISLRTNTVLRWEFKPGSTLFLVWQIDGSKRDDVVALNVWDVFSDSFTIDRVQVLAVKIAYWLGT
jgi:hypothetical protein